MARPKNPFPPKPVPHENRMRCWWNGRWHFLGMQADPDGWRAEYARLVALWSADPHAPAHRAGELLVAELCRAYLDSGDCPGGPRRGRIVAALEQLCEAHAATPVGEFGPAALRAWQAWLCQLPVPGDPARRRYGRASVVERVGVVRQVWKWAVSTERIGYERYEALCTVPGPRRGTVREPRVVEPADPEAVRATLPFLRPPVRSLVLLEWATGARPSELCGMTCGEIRREGVLNIPGAGRHDLTAEGVWVYVPDKHKTAGKGKARFVVFGPAEQELLKPLIEGREPGEFVFRPKDALASLRDEQRAERAARGGGSGGNRKKAKAERTRSPGNGYDSRAYYHAVRRACDRAGVARWYPYQLRHLSAAEIKAAFDVDAVMAQLGHHTRTMGEHYGGRSFKKAAEIARKRAES